MRIESIEIHNFRQYRSVKFDFPRNREKNDIHIIIGETGEGKTNILNALTWCLYEDEMHLGNKSSAITMINTQYVQELRNHGERTGEVSVSVEMSSDEERNHWTIIRQARFSVNAPDPINIENTCIVMEDGRNGSKTIDNPDDVNALIQRYVPKNINEYIFFDGEHLDDYFKDTKKQNIESGIKDLTQASIVEKSIKSLEKYIRNEINPQLVNSGNDIVSSAQTKVDDLTLQKENQENVISIIEDQNKIHNQHIVEYTDKIRGYEGLQEKALTLERLEKEGSSLVKKEKELNASMMKFIREFYTYFALYPSMKAFSDYIQKQSDAGNLPPKIDRKLVVAMLQEKKCLICDQPLDDKHIQGIMNLLKRLEVSSDTSAELNRASSALNAYFDKLSEYPERKKYFIKESKELHELIDKNDAEYAELNEYMKNIPDSDNIKDAITKRELEKDALKAQTIKLGKEIAHLERIKDELDVAQNNLNKAMAANEQFRRFKAQVDFCQDSIKILSATKDEIITECREELQEVTFNIFQKLMWKKDTFAKIEILDDYSFILRDIYGTQTLGSCSAAERALLALSFTLALQEISGHDSLLYIDTPVGRVGTRSRKTFVDVLKEISDKKQVILTFTPSEYDINVQEGLSNSYSSYCELKYEDGVTSITNKK